MVKNTTTKTSKKSGNTQSALTRSSIVIVGLVASIGLAVTAWWLWTAILQDPLRQKLDIIGYATLVGLALSSIGGIISAFMFTGRHPLFPRIFNISVGIGIASVIASMIICAFTYLPNSGALESFAEAYRSFINFGRLDLGAFAISTTGTLALIGGIALIIALAGSKKK